MQSRTALCAVSFVFAYSLLIPGLVGRLFSAKASFFGIVLVDLEKSTFGTIELLFKEGSQVPAFIILFCSVIMPFVKLIGVVVYCLCVSRGWLSDHRCNDILAAVQQVSKWATLDIFAAATIVGFFCTNPMVDVQLHEGFYCFLGYCTLSIAAALAMEPAGHAESGERMSLLPTARFSKSSPAMAILGSGVLLALLAVVSCLPVLKMQSAKFMINHAMSVRELIMELWTHHSKTAATSMLAYVAIFPALDFILIAMNIVGYRVSGSAPIHHFAMLDVFALSIVVVAMATSGLNSNLKMTVLPAGWILCGVAVFGRALKFYGDDAAQRAQVSHKGKLGMQRMEMGGASNMLEAAC